MKFLKSIIFLVPFFVYSENSWSRCSSYSYDCSYCGATSCSCTTSTIIDPTYNTSIFNSIPFAWSNSDTNTGNDVCSGSV